MSENLFPALIYARDSAESEAVELRVVEYQGDTKIERQWALHPDKAISLGIEMIQRGWRLKGAAVVP